MPEEEPIEVKVARIDEQVKAVRADVAEINGYVKAAVKIVMSAVIVAVLSLVLINAPAIASAL